MIIKGISRKMPPLVLGCPFSSTLTLNITDYGTGIYSISMQFEASVLHLLLNSHDVLGILLIAGCEQFQIDTYIQSNTNVYHHFVSIVRFFRIWSVSLSLSIFFFLVLRETLTFMHGFLAVTTCFRMLLQQAVHDHISQIYHSFPT